MKQIIKQNQKFEQYELDYDDAKNYLLSQKEKYKLELVNELYEK